MTDKEMFRIAKEECHMIQQESEILWALREARLHFGSYVPRIIVELGCHGGGSLCMWSRLIPDGGLLVGVSPVANEDIWMNRVKSITGKNVKLINGLSESPHSKQQLECILNGRKADFLFIDTIHIYEQTRQEANMYFAFVDVPGIIALHDIAIDIGKGGTGDYWNESKYQYNYVEKHDKAGGDNFGIGILLL